MMKHWSIVFKTLSNINRLKIIEMLTSGREMTVTEISEKLGVSLASTSAHLVMLKDLDVLNNKGKNNNVYYSINSTMPPKFKLAIKLFSNLQ